MAGLFFILFFKKKMKNKKSHPPGEFGYALAPRQGRLRLGNSKSEEIFKKKQNKTRRKIFF
jgi:hypothetical protein